MYHLSQTRASHIHITTDDAPLTTPLLHTRDGGAPTAHAHACLLVYAAMILSGTQARSRENILSALSDIGATLEVNAHELECSFSLRVRTSVFPTALKLLEEILTTPRFTRSELRRVQMYLKNSLTVRNNDARLQARIQFLQKAYAKSDYRFPSDIRDVQKAIDQVRIQDLVRVHTLLFSTPIVATSSGESSSLKKIDMFLQKVCTSSETVFTLGEGTLQKLAPHYCEISRPHTQNIELSIGHALPLTRSHPDFIPFSVGISILGLAGGFQGRLMSRVREKEGLTYSIYAHLEHITTRSGGVCRIATYFHPSRIEQGISSTLREIALIAKEGVSARECDNIIRSLTTRHTLLHDSLHSVTQYYHGMRISGHSREEAEEIPQLITQVKAREINHVLAQYLQPQALIVSASGPLTRSITTTIKKILH